MEASCPSLPVPTVASSPFNKPNADVILRASDNVDFLTYKAILSLASPVFEDMFEIPQPPPSAVMQDIPSENGLPVVSVTETSVTLDRLFPIANPLLRCISDIAEVLMAAQKYQMKEATAQLSKSLLGFSASAPYPTYAVACRYGLEDAARAATLQYWTTNLSLAPESRATVDYVPEMDLMPAGALYRLLRFCYEAKNQNDFVFHPESSRATSIRLKSPLASHPFSHPSTNSDVILRSSDGVHFHVIGLLLAIASPVFAEIVNQSTDSNTTSGLRVIRVTEDSHMLLWILHFCYPMADPQVRSDDLDDVLTAARKYDIARLTQFAKQMCVALAETEALRAYLIAMREGWEEEAKEVAKHAVYQRRDISLPEMEEVSAKAYYRLLTYRHRCLKTVSDVISKYSYATNIDTRWTAHWSRSAVYGPQVSSADSPYKIYDTLQVRFAMLTVVNAPFTRLAGVLAPGLMKRFQSGFNDAFSSIVPESDKLAGELKAALLKVEI